MTDEIPTMLENGLRTPDGTEIFSRHRHDYVTHVDKNGKKYFIDGGLDYIRRSNHGDEIEITTYYMPSNHGHNRTYARWGSYGLTGHEPIKYIRVKNLEVGHIRAILEKCIVARPLKSILETELRFRDSTNTLIRSKS